ncbi:MAG TPA: ISL3 family transposase [Gemmatimonadaceae bacterium]|nr:ISL3 family transposase [Gemmatimonadaceae bacterium]
MANEEITALLGGWEGFELVGVERSAASTPQSAPQILLTLRPVPTHPKRCSGCGEIVAELHDVAERRVRDLPILEAETWLILPRVRLRCPRCGPTVEAVPWLDRYQRMTTRLAEAIARLARVLPIKHVALWFGVGWETVKQIDKRALVARLGPVDLSDVRVIALDEFAIQRGHRYATIVVEVPSKRVLWVGRGRSRDEIRPFFTLLGPAGCARLEAVVMDMSPAYREEVRAHCPQAALVYDLFHVVAKYGREVIDRVRVDETNRLGRAAGRDRTMLARRRVIKGTRWLLLRNRENVTRAADRLRLRELLAANRALFTVYVLKDDLKQLWRFTYPGAARRFWQQWYRRACSSRIAPLRAFAQHLAALVDGIINHCRYPLNTGLLEGINNKIKVLKRIAYGYRDDAYFFLKIRAAFPGNP